jgi:outer membrane protein assembly factor BamB
MARCPLPVVLLLLLAAGSVVGAEPAARTLLPGESVATSRRLEAGDKLAIDKQYAAAAEEYARIIEEVGDELVPADVRLSVPARRLCQLRLAALPPDVLRTYRNRVDPQAKKWLEQGTADRDPRPLERLVEQAFCSRPAGAALDVLGDLAFERGQFHQAERWWRMLALPASEAVARAKQPTPPPWSRAGDAPEVLELLYPDPPSDPASARAKQILALLFRGERKAARAELEAFRAQHAKATGHLAGRTGNYAEILQDIASRPVPPEPGDSTWPTFGGSPSRAAVLPAEPADPNRLNRLVEHGPAGQPVPLCARAAVDAMSVNKRAQYLAFEPVIVGRRVLVANARSVTALDPSTGTVHKWDLGQDGKRPVDDPNGLKLVPSAAVPPETRYTLTVADGRVYARLGVPALDPSRQGAKAASYLVCLDQSEPGGELRTVWLRDADPPAKGYPPMFEGTPVVRDGLLHVAATRFEGGLQMTTEIRCYSADTGAPRWKVDVSTTRDISAAPRHRHQLLTLAGRHVVYVSHAGSIAALDARTGRRAWSMHYASTPLRTPGGNAVPRDLAPAVYAEGRLFCAPADYDRLLCLDPETGQVLWERERVAVVHLLGVGNGRLIFTTTKGIRALRAVDGSDADGWETPRTAEHPGLPPYGRGFLAGDCVFWPTADGVKVLSQADGLPPPDLIPGPLERQGSLPPGNLAYANGILAVADDTSLRVYVAPARTESAPVAAPANGVARAVDDLSRRAIELTAAGRPAEAVSAWQQVLADENLRRGMLHDAKRLPQRAAIVAAERIDELLRAHGRDLYRSAEEKAHAMLGSGRRNPVALERLVDEYPNATAAGPALLQLARLHEDAGHWGAAAHAYRRLLRRETTSDERRAACSGLNRAREHEQQRVSLAPADPAVPLTRCWEKDERLLPMAEESPGGEVLLVWHPPASAPPLFGPGRGGFSPLMMVNQKPASPTPLLICRNATTGQERWAHPVAEPPTWAGRHGDCVVVAGPTRVQAFALSDWTCFWELPAPDAEHFVDARLSSFQIAGGRFFCLQGECRLLALDAESGRVLWQNWSPAARLGSDVPGARFSPHYLATPERVLLQFAGRCRVLDAGNGALVAETPTETILWAQAPLPLGGGRAAVLTGRRNVACVDLTTGHCLWSYALPHPESLTGELPLLEGSDGTLLVVVPRNYGYCLCRVNVDTGRPLWSEEASIGPDRIDAASACVDSNAVHHVSRNIVTALALDDGRVLWRESLPDPQGSWHLRHLGRALLAWPAEGRQLKIHSRWLTGWLELSVPAAPEAEPGRGIPVLVLDPKDGQALERLNLVPPAPRPRTLPATAPALLVSSTATGLVIGWDERVWALRSDEERLAAHRRGTP